MSQGYSLKAENKPLLFSWDLDTEFKNIDRWILDNKKYSRRNLENELKILKEIASDYLQVIKTRTLEPSHLENLSEAITNGPSGVWEQATTKLERLAYHFESAKVKIKELFYSSSTNVTDRALTMLNGSFSEDEQLEIIAKALSHKSKMIRERAVSTAFLLNKRAFFPVLEARSEIEENQSVKEAIDLTMEHLKQSSN
jgi:hypothetical protein